MKSLAIVRPAALCIVVAFLATSAFAQTPLSKTAAYKAPRNAIGQPDLGENWTNATLTTEQRQPKFGTRSAYTPDEVKKLEQAVVDEIEVGNRPTAQDAPVNVDNGLQSRPEFVAAGGNVGGYNRGWLDPGSTVMRVRGEPRTSLLTTPDGRVPQRKQGAVRPTGAPRGSGGAFDNPESRSLGERCIIGFGRNGGPPMLANGFYNNNYRFVQSKDAIAIEIEMAHDIRTIHLNAKHRTDGQRPYFGDSIGHWEGDTLVVETTNIPQSQEYNGSWKDLKVTERFTRTAKDRLFYQYVIEDPTQWDKPWGGEYEFAPLDGTLMEYACHEGNYALEGILAGARQNEEPAKAAAR